MPVDFIIICAVFLVYSLGIAAINGYQLRRNPYPSDADSVRWALLCLTWPIAWIFILAFWLGYQIASAVKDE